MQFKRTFMLVCCMFFVSLSASSQTNSTTPSCGGVFGRAVDTFADAVVVGKEFNNFTAIKEPEWSQKAERLINEISGLKTELTELRGSMNRALDSTSGLWWQSLIIGITVPVVSSVAVVSFVYCMRKHYLHRPAPAGFRMRSHARQLP